MPSPEGMGTRTVPEAWAGWLEAGKGIPKGLSPFLRTAKVREVGGDVEIVPVPGPAEERLADPAVLERIAGGLAPFLGRRPTVRVVAREGGGAPPSRISPDEVRADTLKSLYRKEPRLEQAVEELDLELME